MVINVWVRARAAMTDENATKMLAYVLRNAAHIQGWPDVRFYAWDSLCRSAGIAYHDWSIYENVQPLRDWFDIILNEIWKDLQSPVKTGSS